MVDAFLNSDGSEESVAAIKCFLIEKGYLSENCCNKIPLEDDKQKFLVEMSACVASEKVFPVSVLEGIEQYGRDKDLFLLAHLLTYVGCPNVWNTMVLNFH